MKLKQISALVLARENKDAGMPLETGKMLPHLQRCGLPLHKPPKDYLLHLAHDGDVRVEITAKPQYGMPFGSDLLTLFWCFTAAVKQNSRTVRFSSAAAILAEMKLPPDTRNYRAIVASLQRIFGATYFFEWKESGPALEGKPKRNRMARASLIDAMDLWFMREAGNRSRMNTITISEFAWDWLKRSPRLEIAPALALRHSPGAQRLFFIVGHRAPRVRGSGYFIEIPITGPDGLDKQMGSAIYQGQQGQKRWRQLLRKWIAELKVYWRESHLELANLTGQTRGGVPKLGWYLQVGYIPEPPC